jgi:Polysaccharide lyase
MGMRPSTLANRLLVVVLACVTAAAVVVATAAAAPGPVVQRATLSASKAHRYGHRRVWRRSAVAARRRRRRTGTSSPRRLLFRGSRISDFDDNQSAPGAVSEVPDPAGGGERVLKMTVDDGDVAPVTPTENPRAQLVTPHFVEPGDELWWHTRFYLPRDFPADVPGWLTVLEGPYGYPYDGSPPVSISVDEDEIRFQRNDSYRYDVPWHQPIERGRWIDVLFHTRFDEDGFVELWIDGRQVTFFDQPGDPSSFNPFHEAPTQRLQMKTRDHTNDGATNFFVIQSYRKRNMFDSLTLYHGPTEVGTSRASVEG